MMIADNLIKCNDHFRVLAAAWRLKGKDAARHPRQGRRPVLPDRLPHGGGATDLPPSVQPSSVITFFKKLIRFPTSMRSHLISSCGTSTPRWRRLPRKAHREEAVPLAEELARVQKQRGAGPQRLGEILPAVLAKLGVGLVRSTESGETDPT